MTDHVRVVTSAPGKDRRRWTPEPSVANWETFAAWLVDGATEGGKYGRPYSPVTLKAAPGRRLNANLAARHVLTLDADAAGVDYLDRLAAVMPFASLSHTTASHTPGAPRWRTLVPLSRATTPAEAKSLAAHLVDALGRERFDVQASTSPVAVAYATAWHGVEYHQHDGPVLDVDDELLVATPVEWSPGDAAGQLTVAEFLDEHEVTDIGDLPGCPYGRATLDAVAADLEGTDEGTGVHSAIFAAACRFVELVQAGCWSVRDLGRLQGVAHSLRAEPRPHELDEALAGALGKGCAPDTGCRDHSETANLFDAVPIRLDDAHLAEWMAHRGLGGLWSWAGGLGWMHWDGRRWVPQRDENVREAIRKVMIDVNRLELIGGADTARMKALAGLLSSGRIGAVAHLLRGVVAVDGGQFDQLPDLLNVGNGVVDLRRGTLGPHDPTLRLTKITDTEYVPGATHPDWDQALTALDPEVAEWMQARLGQGATGYPPDDDILPIGQGSGSNGKSTLLAGLFVALGEHMSQVPERLIRASPNDHPTELMTLRGARIAVIDETPEVADLNVPRIKAMLGTDYITARQIRRDNVTWRATHSLFVMTNYRPRVHETDHGTWRRLALVRFTRKFPQDSRFRAAIARGTGGRREAVLAWVVEGARRWYAEDGVMPEMPGRVQDDTTAWRVESDLVLGYVMDRLVADPSACVMTSEVLEDLNAWLEVKGHKPWSSQLLTSRFDGHSITKERPKKAAGLSRRYVHSSTRPARPWVFTGYRWRRATDPD